MRYILAVYLSLSFVFATDTQKSFKVEGMHCGYGCVNKVKSVVTSIEGVKTCDVDFEKSLMTVVYDEKKIDSNKIITSLSQETTYTTTSIDENKGKEKKKTFWSKLKNLFNKKS